MALVPSFTVAATATPGSILLTDTSTGSDGTIVDRKILIYLSSGALFTTIDWPYASSSITIAPFSKDYAVNIVVNWNNSVPATIYSFSQLFAATGFGEQFFYNLCQQIAAQPSIVNDTNFMDNFYRIRILIEGAGSSIETGSDINSSQNMIDLYTQLTQNASLYF